jgi:hypothetical protein
MLGLRNLCTSRSGASKYPSIKSLVSSRWSGSDSQLAGFHYTEDHTAVGNIAGSWILHRALTLWNQSNTACKRGKAGEDGNITDGWTCSRYTVHVWIYNNEIPYYQCRTTPLPQKKTFGSIQQSRQLKRRHCIQGRHHSSIVKIFHSEVGRLLLSTC